MFIPSQPRRQIYERDHHRCAYCLTSQDNSSQRLQIDHIVPRAQDGESVIANLCLACSSCNSHKHARQRAIDPISGEAAALFHPMQQEWGEYFAWDESHTLIIRLTACERATIVALNMNHQAIVWARRRWVEAGWHPPE